MKSENRDHAKQIDQIFFLNGWIGVRLAEKWLRVKGFDVERSIAQRRGTEKAVSSGDIDLVARNASGTVYIEVKFWGAGSKPYPLNPSWLVKFMLDRNKLNTLFEPHQDATGYMLLYRNPATKTFAYRDGLKFVDRLVSHYKVPLDLIRGLSGQSSQEFAETVLRFLVQKRVGRDVEFRIVYFKQILKELGQARLDAYRTHLKGELLTLFETIYSDVIWRSQRSL